MSLDTTVKRTLSRRAPETDSDGILFSNGRYTLVAKFMLMEVGLLATGLILDMLSGKTGEQPGTLSIIAGLIGAFTVLIGAIGGIIILAWGGFILIRSRFASEKGSKY